MSSDRLKALSLVPFAYSVTTRQATRRDFGYLVASAWLPGIWLLIRLGGLGPGAAALHFAAGYLAFIALYEIGYFVNDAWDASRAENGRRRIRFAYDRTYVAAFIAVRLAAWAAIGTVLGWIDQPIWLAGHAALVVVFAAHNLIEGAAFRAASFFQLACLRFVLPLIGDIPQGKLALLLFIAVVFYTYMRFLSYLEGKGLLGMTDRRNPFFGLIQMGLLAPLVAFAAYASGEAVLLELLGYSIVIYGGYALLARH